MSSSCFFCRFLHRLSVAGTGIFLLILLGSALISPAAELNKAKRYITNGGYALANGAKILTGKNLTTPFIPASTLKLVTSLAALEILGPQHHFSTSLFLDTKNNLYIRGSGDPFLTSEKVLEITKLIAGQGITRLNDIVLDDSGFLLEHPTPGAEKSLNPYDAQCSVLGVNFNTLPIRILQNAKIQSSEKQTPYVPLMGKLGMSLPSGLYRLNINAFPDQAQLPNALRYCGQLFYAQFEKSGVSLNGKVRKAAVPDHAKLLLRYRAAETVTDLIRSCLLSSSNFMANQLYLALGAKRFGTPATWEKSNRAMEEYISNTLQLSENEISITEGSGLSKQNRITPVAMLKVLEKFKPYAHLLPKKLGVMVKSGTLGKSGVFCYAGYFSKGKSIRSFVIFLNQKKNNRDKLLRLLHNHP